MEIERKYTVKCLPDNLENYPSHLIEQGYLNTNPVVRVRREDDNYYMTYKGSGMIAREEYNLPLTADAYSHLIKKCDGNIITKVRHLIPLNDPVFKDNFVPKKELNLTIELDVFKGVFEKLVIAEIEFPDIETADALIPPDWFLEDVSLKKEYHNSYLSALKL